LPRLAARVPWIRLGDWPTPLDPIEIDGRTLWVKREGESSALYGGNKIRTLEAWLGHARAGGFERIWAIGAYGSNHAIATVLHARAIGLDAGAIVFPQPASPWAIENAGALIDSGCPLVRLANVALVPFAGIAIARREPRSVVMPPGGATPIGTLGALSAAFELADQIAAGDAPPPKRIVLAVGSTCTTAGLLAGVSLAHAIGVWRWPLPIIHGVRVTPWPVTSRAITAQLAARTLGRIAKLGGPVVPIDLRELLARLVIDGSELGPGYGRATATSGAASDAFGRTTSLRLDGVYSAKAAAALLRLHRCGVGPLVFWATKSSVRLNDPAQDMVAGASRVLARWLTSSLLQVRATRN
jgi:D-cysteine desulfhydrase